MENYCVACGMPLAKEEDIGAKLEMGPVCKFCVKEDGTVRTCGEIFEGGVQFFLKSVPGVDRELAERITRKNMKNQPYWQGKDCEVLKGEQATDQEFKDALRKLHSEQE